MIALDFDGVIANYGDHVSHTCYNVDLLSLLPGRQPVAIVTNQGGMAFSRHNPERYPSPRRVAHRLYYGCIFMRRNGYPVQAIYISAFHPKAAADEIQYAARSLRSHLRSVTDLPCTIYTTERARKPHPLMLRAAGATCYYGDSPEDAQAAQAAGVPFVAVPRFT